MLTQYSLRLTPAEGPALRGSAEWGYRLYGALLEGVPPSFGAVLHREGVTPVSQYLLAGEEALEWRVTLLGRESQAVLGPLLEGRQVYRLIRDRVELQAEVRRRTCVDSVEELFALSAGGRGLHRLDFRTPTAFKSRGRYLILPNSRLSLQSLVRQWNGCFPDCPIEDQDGQGVEAMSEGLLCRGYRLRDQSYPLKGSRVPGFVGELTLENRLAGFHRTLADALLYFSGFSGVGIKTALGMGGVEHSLCT